MRTLAFSLVLCAAQVAGAAHLTAHPADVFAVVDAAPPRAELAAWSQAVGALVPGAGAALPPAEQLPTFLGSLVGAAKLDGLDLDRPLHLVLVNPQKYPSPIVLVLPVRDAHALEASVKGTKVVVRAEKGSAVVGMADALAAAGDVRALVHDAAHGIHATAFVEPIWAAYGAQVTATLNAGAAALQSEAKAKTKKSAKDAPAATIAASIAAHTFSGLVSAAQQTERLGIDLGAEGGGVELAVALDVKPGTALDGIFGAQHPSTFALLPKLANRAAPVVYAGTLDITTVTDLLLGMFDGSDAWTARVRTLMRELASVSDGNFAMAATMRGEAQLDGEILMGVRDASRAAAFYEQAIALMKDVRMFGGAVQSRTKALPPFRYDGIRVSQLRTTSRLSLPDAKGRQKRTTISYLADWATFDGLIGYTLGSDAATAMRKLIGSARHGKDTLTLDGAVAASLDAARAAKESLWIRMDLGALTQAAATQAAAKQKQPAATPAAPSLPSGTAATLGLAFAPHHARLRIAVGR